MKVPNWKLALVLKAFSVPSLMVLVAVIPGVSLFFYTPHSAVGWFFTWASFPWILWVFGRDCIPNKVERARHWRFSSIAVIAYVILSYPIGQLVERHLNELGREYGFEVAQGIFWRMLTFPLGQLVDLMLGK